MTTLLVTSMDIVTLAKLRQVSDFLWKGISDEQNSIFKPSEAIIVKEYS